LWIPIKELREADIGNFLEGKRLEGYTIAGIEQTDRSIILGSSEFKFPKKTVLLVSKDSITPQSSLLLLHMLELSSFLSQSSSFSLFPFGVAPSSKYI